MKNITFRNLNEGLDNLYFKNLPFDSDQLEGNDIGTRLKDEVKDKLLSLDPNDGAEDEFAENDCVMSSAEKVMEAYQNANKWLDTIKEAVYTDMSCVFFSSYIHQLAHTMPERFDKFGDILHTMNFKIPYPETRYIPNEPHSIDDVFSSIFMVLDNIKNALNEFIKCTDDKYHGMACAAEALLNDIEGEYPMLFRLRDEWMQCDGDKIKFDKYVNQYVKGKDDLLESLHTSIKENLIDEDALYDDEDGYEVPDDSDIIGDTYYEFRHNYEFEGSYTPATWDKTIGGMGGWSPEEYPELVYPDEEVFKETAINMFIERFCEMNHLDKDSLTEEDKKLLTRYFLENASLPDYHELYEEFSEWEKEDDEAARERYDDELAEQRWQSRFEEDLTPRGF